MGEHADYITEQDPDPEDEDGYEQPSAKTCRFCGKTGLHWGERNGKWRLHDGRGMHVCRVKPLKEPLPRAPKRGAALPLPAGYAVVWTGGKVTHSKP